MAIRQGLIQGLIQGLKGGINYWEGAAETIYTQLTIGDVDTFINTALSTSLDFTPIDVFSCNDLTENGGLFVNGSTSHDHDLFPQGGALDTVSPNGRSIVCDGASKYWKQSASTSDYVFNTAPFAIAHRVKFTGAAPGSSTQYMSKGAGAANDYGFGLNTDGTVYMRVKFMGGGIITASTSESVVDGEWHWIIGGRTSNDDSIWISLSDDFGSTSVDPSKDLNNAANAFGLWNSIGGNAPVALELDHLIVWTGNPANRIRSNKDDLFTTVFSD